MRTQTYDNSPEVEISPADEALDTFRNLFPLPATRVQVDPDGNTMRVRMRNERIARIYLDHARQVIASHNLPLEACIEDWSKRGLTFEIQLEIKYNHRLNNVSCL